MVELTWVVLVARGPCVVVLHAVVKAAGVCNCRISGAVPGPVRARRTRASFTRRQGDSTLRQGNERVRGEREQALLGTPGIGGSANQGILSIRASGGPEYQPPRILIYALCAMGPRKGHI